VQNQFPAEAIEWLRIINRLAGQGIRFGDMRPLLLKELGKKKHSRKPQEDLRALDQQWKESVAKIFERRPDEPTSRELESALVELLSKAKELDDNIGAEDELDRAIAHFYRVARLSWTLHTLTSGLESTALVEFLNEELHGAYIAIIKLCGLFHKRVKPKVPPRVAGG
jgi:DNA-binding transcriptional MerR regulator